ncbi:porin family protein [Methylobacterium sp. C25]|uniref:outer membrane protein n=1 Tax=Methylobacterium sp. C25 TaxID=2721622 RepID=UPI001F1EF206|nr:outer membrane beta-barrel protein [Methylobacterium sp. C25]MCE4223771.1 porin family protein [Methylobacterium sp. C25]
MRKLTIGFLALTALGSMSTARAADFADDYLRGPDYEPVSTQVIDWSGFYIGGHGGYSSAGLGFKNVLQDPLATYFRNRDIEQEFAVSSLLTLPSKRVGGTSFGGFAGYNFQFDDAVVGVEVDYTSFDRNGASINEISRRLLTTGGMAESLYVKGTSATQLEDFGTVRGRVGYAFGNFLPFVSGGFAVGRATVFDEAVVQNYGYDRKTYEANQALTTGSPAAVYNHGYKQQPDGSTAFNQNYPENGTTPAGQGVQTTPAPATVVYSAKKSKAVAGVALGGGVEYAITSNFLIRGEYQYVLFNDFNGHKVNVNTVRAGAAYKF